MLGDGVLSYPLPRSEGVRRQIPIHLTPETEQVLGLMQRGAAAWKGLPESNQAIPFLPLLLPGKPFPSATTLSLHLHANFLGI